MAVGLLCPAVAEAGAWNRDSGDALFILTESYGTGSRVFDRPALDPVSFEKFTSRFYLEYGLTQKVTAIANAAYLDLTYVAGDRQLDYQGFDRTQLGLQYQIARKQDFALSLQTSYIFKGGAPDDVLSVQQDTDLIEARLQLGLSRSYAKSDIFMDAQIATRLSPSGSSDGHAASVTAGWKPHGRWQIMSQSNVEYRSARGTDIFPIPQRSRVRSNLSALYRTSKRTTLQFGVETVWAGEAVVAETGPFLGFWVDF